MHVNGSSAIFYGPRKLAYYDAKDNLIETQSKQTAKTWGLRRILREKDPHYNPTLASQSS